MAAQYGLVDTLMNLPDPPGGRREEDPNIARWFHQSKVLREGAAIEQTLADMDAASIERGLLTFRGIPRDDASFDEASGRVADGVAASNDRLAGFMLFDPRDAMDGVRLLERSVREHGFVNCHITPSSVGLPPNPALYYLL